MIGSRLSSISRYIRPDKQPVHIERFAFGQGKTGHDAKAPVCFQKQAGPARQNAPVPFVTVVAPGRKTCPFLQTKQVRVSIASLSTQPFPEQKTGRPMHRLFRGLLELHSRYGLLDRSAAQGGLVTSLRLPVAKPSRSPVSGSIDNSLIHDARRRGPLYTGTAVELACLLPPGIGRRARDECDPACHHSNTDRNSRAPC